MPRTLTGKIVAVLTGLVFLISIFYIGLTVVVTRLNFQEITQNLNRSLAANVVNEPLLTDDREIDMAVFKLAFDRLMDINPAIELYLIGPDGRILAFSAPQGTVQRDRIDLAPVHAFLDGATPYPIRGDDPRDAGARKVFSAAPISGVGTPEGYVYIVLGGQQHDTVTRMFQGSFILRLTAGIAGASALVSLAAGFLSFNWLTRRLRRLGDIVDAFRQSDFRAPVRLPQWRRDRGGDEIDRLGLTFEQMSERIADQVHLLEHADASRRELIANISHDLRTPMAALQGSLETLQIKADSLTGPEKERYLDLALKHSKRLGRLVAELFELATLESPASQLHIEPFSIGELVQDVAQKFALAAEQKQLTFETTIPEVAPFVTGDIGLIERVLDNLIGNAIKFTPAGGTVAVALIAEADHIVARVSDTGCGIADEDLPRIFDRFYRVDRHAAGAPEGTGLGLAIAKRTLQLHGSPIDVVSRVGGGTTFSFQLAVA